MLQVNGAANAAAIAAARAAGVPRFAYVSAHVPAIPGFEQLMEGYVKGKRQAEEELARQYPDGGGRFGFVAPPWPAGLPACLPAGWGAPPWPAECLRACLPARLHACLPQAPPCAWSGEQRAACRPLNGWSRAAAEREGRPPTALSGRRPLKSPDCPATAHPSPPLPSPPRRAAGGVALRPWIIYGNRAMSSTLQLPLGLLFGPVEQLLKRVPNARALADTPLAGPLFLPPVSVQAVARAAVAAATDDAIPPGVMSVWDIEKYGDA